jgi:hypothetical protein
MGDLDSRIRQAIEAVQQHGHDIHQRPERVGDLVELSRAAMKGRHLAVASRVNDARRALERSNVAGALTHLLAAEVAAQEDSRSAPPAA